MSATYFTPKILALPLSVFPYTLRASSSCPCWAQISLIKRKQKPEIGEPLDHFPPHTELPFALTHSYIATQQTMHNCPTTVVLTTSSSLRFQRRSLWGSVTPTTGRPKWKRSHHQAQRLSSRYTGGETAKAWGCNPLQQEENKVFILQSSHLTRISWSSRLISTWPEGNKRPIPGLLIDKTHLTSFFQPMCWMCYPLPALVAPHKISLL